LRRNGRKILYIVRVSLSNRCGRFLKNDRRSCKSLSPPDVDVDVAFTFRYSACSGPAITTVIGVRTAYSVVDRKLNGFNRINRPPGVFVDGTARFVVFGETGVVIVVRTRSAFAGPRFSFDFARSPVLLRSSFAFRDTTSDSRDDRYEPERRRRLPDRPRRRGRVHVRLPGPSGRTRSQHIRVREVVVVAVVVVLLVCSSFLSALYV